MIIILGLICSFLSYADENEARWRQSLALGLNMVGQEKLLDFVVHTEHLRVGLDTDPEFPKKSSILKSRPLAHHHGTFYLSYSKGDRGLQVFCEDVNEYMLRGTSLNSSFINEASCIFKDMNSGKHISQHNAWIQMGKPSLLNPDGLIVIFPEVKGPVQAKIARCSEPGCGRLIRFLEEMDAASDPMDEMCLEND